MDVLCSHGGWDAAHACAACSSPAHVHALMQSSRCAENKDKLLLGFTSEPVRWGSCRGTPVCGPKQTHALAWPMRCSWHTTCRHGWRNYPSTSKLSSTPSAAQAFPPAFAYAWGPACHACSTACHLALCQGKSHEGVSLGSACMPLTCAPDAFLRGVCALGCVHARARNGGQVGVCVRQRGRELQLPLPRRLAGVHAKWQGGYMWGGCACRRPCALASGRGSGLGTCVCVHVRASQACTHSARTMPCCMCTCACVGISSAYARCVCVHVWASQARTHSARTMPCCMCMCACVGISDAHTQRLHDALLHVLAGAAWEGHVRLPDLPPWVVGCAAGHVLLLAMLW